ncbi:hypothetical protein F5Y08DRAFT_351707 [Xylaria arbuscula]|nr:hypothetical protein F5Y08DRAFT_351707 [Xylaria arbuscula]
MAVEQGTDGRIRAETKYYTSLCQTFIHNKQKALEELSVSLDHLTRCADSLNAMLSQGTTGEMRLHASQASQATTDVLKDVEVQMSSGAIIRITIEKSPASGLNPGEDENAQQVGNQDRGKSAEKSRAQSPSVCTVKSAESVTNNNTARSTKRSSEATTPIQEAELRLRKKPRQAGDLPTIRIQEIKKDFIFEFPHGTSLLWIVQCHSCGLKRFHCRQNPLTANIAMQHWGYNHRNRDMTTQEILEHHVIQVIRGSLGEAERKNRALGGGPLACQPRRVEASKYATPNFMHHLLEKSESLGPETHAHHSKALDPLNKNLNEPTRPSNGQSTEPAQRPPQSRQPRASEMPKEGDDMLRQPPIAPASHRKLTPGSFGNPANMTAHERLRDPNDAVLKTNKPIPIRPRADRASSYRSGPYPANSRWDSFPSDNRSRINPDQDDASYYRDRHNQSATPTTTSPYPGSSRSRTHTRSRSRSCSRSRTTTTIPDRPGTNTARRPGTATPGIRDSPKDTSETTTGGRSSPAGAAFKVESMDDIWPATSEFFNEESVKRRQQREKERERERRTR